MQSATAGIRGMITLVVIRYHKIEIKLAGYDSGNGVCFGVNGSGS
jgi:hypothetical protein